MFVKSLRVKILAIALFMEGGLFVLALFLAWLMNVNLILSSDSVFGDLVLGTAGTLIPLILFHFALSKRAYSIPGFRSLKVTIIRDVKKIFSHLNLFDLFMISLLAGIGEEMFFRGVLQTKFGIIAASMLFGLAHCISVPYVVVTTIMGFYIGIIFQLSGSLLVPIHLHFLYDLSALLYLRYAVKEEYEDESM